MLFPTVFFLTGVNAWTIGVFPYGSLVNVGVSGLYGFCNFYIMQISVLLY